MALILISGLASPLTISDEPHGHATEPLKDRAPTLCACRFLVIALHLRRETLIVFLTEPKKTNAFAVTLRRDFPLNKNA